MTQQAKQNSRFAKRAMVALVLLLLASLVVVLAACGGEEEEPNKYEVKNYEAPAGLAEHALTLEWVGKPYTPNRPTMILFNGVSTYDAKESLTLPSDIYRYQDSNSLLASSAKDMQTDLSVYWDKAKFNVGVFHYEGFADATSAELNEKVLNASAMRYRNTSGELVTQNLPNYNLTQAFVDAWLKHFIANPTNGSVQTIRMMELRFVGNGAGATLALSASEMLFDLYQQDMIADAAVPNRVTFTNPYLDNKQNNYAITHKEGAMATSILDYAAATTQALTKKGVLFELIESDAEHFNRYETPYSGLVEFVKPDDAKADEVFPAKMLGTTGESLTYKSIMDEVAYLHFSETFSKKYPEAYRKLDRGMRDWYLYSINGSDDSSVKPSSSTSIAGIGDTWPMWDDRSSTAGNSILRCAVSAWTPTTYVPVQKGQEYRMRKPTWDSALGENVNRRYTMSAFCAESFQLSDLKGVVVGGFVYYSMDEMDLVNMRYDARVAGLSVRFVVEWGASTRELVATTNAAGYYQVTIPEEYYKNTISVVLTPPKGYQLGSTFASDKVYERMMISTIEGGTKLTDIVVEKGQQQVLIKNAGLFANQK